MLSSRENFARMLTGDNPERLPFDLPLTPPVTDRVERQFGTRCVAGAFDADFLGCGAWFPGKPDRWRHAFEALGAEVPPDAEVDDDGITHVPPPPDSVGEAYHFRQMLHPLSVIRSADQLPALPWPDLDRPAGADGLPAEVRRIRTVGKVAVAGMECTVFEPAWYLRGMDSLFEDLIEGNGIADWLLDWFTERSVRRARLAAAAGVDVIGLGDDVGTQRGMMMAPAFWREHLRPRLHRVIRAIRESTPPGHRLWIRYHSDGDIRPIVDDLVELGVDLLNPVQPECMPVDDVLPAYRDRIGFWGLIGTQTTLPFGSTEDVRNAVAACVDHARAGARLVVAPTHVVEPDVPWENLLALVTALRDSRLA